MLRYVYGQDEIVARFVAQMIPHVGELGFGRCKAIGVIDENGRLIAGVVYSNWNPKAGIIEINGAATTPRWLTRETMRVMYTYPFLQLKCQMVMKLVAAEDERLLRQLAAGGFMFIKAPRIFGRDRDGVLCLLTYEDWCANKFNKKLKHYEAVDPSHLNEAA